MNLGSLTIDQVAKWHHILRSLDGTETLPMEDYLTEEYVALRIALDSATSRGLITDSQADSVERRYIAALENEEI